MDKKIDLFSTEAEDAILAAILASPEIINSLSVQPEDFYQVKNRDIYSTMLKLHRAGEAVNVVTVWEANQSPTSVIGPAELSRLAGLFIHTWDVESYERIVREKSNRRRVLEIASELAKGVYNSPSITDVVANTMSKLVTAGGVTDGAAHIEKYIREAYEFIQERAANPGANWGIPTGFVDYDRLTGGLQKTELLIISGEPGRGKSISVGQMAVQLAATKEPGAVYSLEMAGRQYLLRILSGMSKVPTRAFKTGNLDGDSWSKLNAAVSDASKLQIYMSDATNWSTTQLRADLARLKELYNITWFIVDYSALLNDTGENDLVKLANIIRNLKRICRSLDLAGVVIHAMNKGGIENATAGQANLSGPSQVIYDADVIMLLLAHQPESGYPDPNLITCAIKKGRDIDETLPYFHLVKIPKLPWFGNYLPPKSVYDKERERDAKSVKGARNG